MSSKVSGWIKFVQVVVFFILNAPMFAHAASFRWGDFVLIPRSDGSLSVGQIFLGRSGSGNYSVEILNKDSSGGQPMLPPATKEVGQSVLEAFNPKGAINRWKTLSDENLVVAQNFISDQWEAALHLEYLKLSSESKKAFDLMQVRVARRAQLFKSDPLERAEDFLVREIGASKTDGGKATAITPILEG